MSDWKKCKNILCIRADNMGDLLMSSPAIRALKETFHCRITLLTSSMANLIAPFIEVIDETIVADLPWVKTKSPVKEKEFLQLLDKLKKYHFDAAVIFTVYSQNPLPAAMMAYMAGIPRRLAYCRENPYFLLTDWEIEKEPFTLIQHQVKRDLHLVQSVNAATSDDHLKINFSEEAKKSSLKKLIKAGLDVNKSWLILHPGVSETKREYPANLWIETGKILGEQLGFQLIITGAGSEKSLCDTISKGIGSNCFSAAGLLSMEEFIALISQAPIVISVNTGTVHIAAATQTPVVVLYALTNPQHTPWRVPSSVLTFSVKEELKSKNQVVNFVSEQLIVKKQEYPAPLLIVEELEKLLNYPGII